MDRTATAGFAHLGAAVWFGRQTEALVKTQRNKMPTPTILGKRRNWRGWESNRRASPSRREVRTGSWEAVVAEYREEGGQESSRGRGPDGVFQAVGPCGEDPDGHPTGPGDLFPGLL